MTMTDTATRPAVEPGEARLLHTMGKRSGKGRIAAGSVLRDVARLRRIGDKGSDADLHLGEALPDACRARAHRACEVAR